MEKTLTYLKVILGDFKEVGIIKQNTLTKQCNRYLKYFHIRVAKYWDLCCKTDYLEEMTKKIRWNLHYY